MDESAEEIDVLMCEIADLRDRLAAESEIRADLESSIGTLAATVKHVSAKLAAAEAKVAQCREVLREREFDGIVAGSHVRECSDCGAAHDWTKAEQFAEDVEHSIDCAWKRAMED